MNKRKLERWQAARLLERLRPEMNYLYRLQRRMIQVGFLPSDRLYQLVDKAFDAMHALTVELHYESCDGGVGRPNETKLDNP